MEKQELDHDILASFGFQEIGNSYFHQKMSGLYLSKPFVEAKHLLVKSNSMDKLTSINSVEDLNIFYRAITGEWLYIQEIPSKVISDEEIEEGAEQIFNQWTELDGWTVKDAIVSMGEWYRDQLTLKP